MVTQKIKLEKSVNTILVKKVIYIYMCKLSIIFTIKQSSLF